jgi:hypothetical protein
LVSKLEKGWRDEINLKGNYGSHIRLIDMIF